MISRFILISSNSQDHKKGIYSKSFQSFKGQENLQLKALPLDLSRDLVNLKKLCRKNDPDLQRLFVCESTKHLNKKLKKKQQILTKIREFFKLKTPSLRFWYTGHGYANGDLCIETQQNPQGEPLPIEQILDIYCSVRPQSYCGLADAIYIDACYSGSNIYRAKKYLLKKKPILKLEIYSSSGQQYVSLNTSVGGLLVASVCQDISQAISQKKQQLKKKFQERKPVQCFYTYGNMLKSPLISIKLSEF